MNIVVVHGSAVQSVKVPGSIQPSDLDVIHTVDVSASYAESIARQWAGENGLPSNLPTDVVCSQTSAYLDVPQLPGETAHYVVLRGHSDDVYTLTDNSFPSVLRSRLPDEEWVRLLTSVQAHYIPLRTDATYGNVSLYVAAKRGMKSMRSAVAHMTLERLALLGSLGGFLTKIKEANGNWEDPALCETSVLSNDVLRWLEILGDDQKARLAIWNEGGEWYATPHRLGRMVDLEWPIEDVWPILTGQKQTLG